MNSYPPETLGALGEHEAIRRLVAQLGSHPLLRTGAGDDCAVTQLAGTGFDQVFTTDPLIEHIHFTSGEKPERIGHKAAGRVLSDLAAMGAQPQWLLVNVVASPEQNIQYLEKIYAGLTALCQTFGATLIGGDLAQGPHLELHVFATGTVPAGQALLRSGAHLGDSICTTGPLGGSRTGWHLDFTPRVTEGIFLRETGWISSMMDLSDGLATDLRHVLKQSAVGAILEANRIPKNGSLDQALYDGEDFELLFTLPQKKAQKLAELWCQHFKNPFSVIGHITDQTDDLYIRDPNGTTRQLTRKAFEHFATSAPH